MKIKSFISIVLISVFFMSFALNSTDNQKNKNSLENNIKLIIDTNKSIVSWRGYEIIKSDLSSHYGVAKLKEGEVIINPSTKSIISGRAVVDMTSFESFDLNNKPKLKTKLDNHLKGEYFLDVEKYPTAMFQVTEYKKLDKRKYNAQITGNLTLKGITKSVSFRAITKGDMSKIEMISEEFDINRQAWGIKLKDYGERLTKDVVTMQIKLFVSQ